MSTHTYQMKTVSSQFVLVKKEITNVIICIAWNSHMSTISLTIDVRSESYLVDTFDGVNYKRVCFLLYIRLHTQDVASVRYLLVRSPSYSNEIDVELLHSV